MDLKKMKKTLVIPSKKNSSTKDKGLSKADKKAEKRRREETLASVIDPTVPSNTVDIFSDLPMARLVSPDRSWGLAAVLDVNQPSIGGLSSRDNNDEAKGSFTHAVNKRQIEGFTSDNLFNKDMLGLLLTSKTISNMDGFLMLVTPETRYQLALIDLNPADIDELNVQVLKDVVNFDELKLISAGKKDVRNLFEKAGEPSAIVENSVESEDVNDKEYVEGHIEDSDSHADSDSDYQPEHTIAALATADADDEIVVQDEDQPNFGEEFYETEIPVEDHEETLAEEFIENTTDTDWNKESDTEVDHQVDEPDFDDQVDQVEYDDRVIDVDQVRASVTRRFVSDGLDLKVELQDFYDYFGDPSQIVPFPTDLEISEFLGAHGRDLIKDFNSQLLAEHEATIEKIKREYITLSARSIDQVVSSTSLQSENSDFGKLMKAAQHDFESREDQARTEIAERQKAISDEFEAKKKQEGNRAYADAVARYQERYGSRVEKQRADVSESIHNGNLVMLDESKKAILDLRQSRAEYDVAVHKTAILQRLSEKYASRFEEELAKREEFAQRLETFVRDHLRDDVARAETLSEKLRQDNAVAAAKSEAEARVREYKADHAAEMDRLRAENSRLATVASEMLDDHKAETQVYIQQIQDKLAKRESVIEELRQEVQHTSNRKDEEYQDQVENLRSEIDSQRDTISQMESGQARTTKIMIFMVILIGVLGGLAGLIIGALISRGLFSPSGVILPMDAGQLIGNYLGGVTKGL